MTMTLAARCDSCDWSYDRSISGATTFTLSDVRAGCRERALEHVGKTGHGVSVSDDGGAWRVREALAS